MRFPDSVEAGSNTSTVTLRVVGGDEKESLKTETVKYGHEPQWTRTRERVRWRGPAAYTQDRPVLSSERAPHIKKTVIVKRVINIWSWPQIGSTRRLTDWLTVSRNVTLTLILRLHTADWVWHTTDPSSRQRERPTSTSLQLSKSNKDLVLSPRWVLYSKTNWPTEPSVVT
jgi:hypothetical protein